MPYRLTAEPGQTIEDSYVGKAYVSPITSRTECVAFVQATVPNIGSTSQWKAGDAIKQGDKHMPAGTAIATFVDGKYPGPGKSKHAAIYLSQDEVGIQVLDQWAAQGKVLKRTIRWKVPPGTKIQNDATAYSVIEK